MSGLIMTKEGDLTSMQAVKKIEKPRRAKNAFLKKNTPSSLYNVQFQ